MAPRRDDPVDWYCRIVATGEAFGPITDGDLRNLAEQGRVGRHDMVARSPDGPWYPAAQVRGLFAAAPPAGGRAASATNRDFPPPRSPVIAASSGYAAPIPVAVPSAAENTDSADAAALAEIRRKRRLKMQRRKKLLQTLVAVFLVANAALLVVILLPRSRNSPDAVERPPRTKGDQASEKLRPLETTDLDSLLSKSGITAAPQAAEPSDLAAAAAAFGESLRKLSDQVGNLRIVIEKIEQGYPELRQGDSRAWPPAPVLVLTLSISHTGSISSTGGGSAINYRGWKGSPETAYLSLSPTGPPIARLRNLAASVEVVGSAGPSKLAPGDSLRDVLLFTLPEQQAETWYCTLAGDPVGAKGKHFRFIIPTKDIVEMPIPPEVAKRLGRTASPDNREGVTGDDGGIGPPPPPDEPQSTDGEEKPFGNEPIPIPGVKKDATEDDRGAL
ncbi:MAG: GYF domain-containing protein [Thermogutta sp.]